MALAAVKTFVAGEVLFAADLNALNTNILNNPISLISPLTGNINHNNTQATNFRLENLSATPAAGQAGRMVFQTSQNLPEVDDGATLRRIPAVASSTIVAGDLIVASTGLGWIRSAGAWTTPAYSGGNFTGGAAQTWTVEAGDIGTYAHIIIGKTMTVAWVLVATSVGGTPDPVLNIAIPSGKVAARDTTAVGRVSDNGGAAAAGVILVSGGGSVIKCYKDLSQTANWTAAANTTTLYGTITFEIQ